MCTDWNQFIDNESKKEYFVKIMSVLEEERKLYTVYPHKSDIFNSFYLTELNKIKCVIIGQDPYFNKDEAHGFAFSVNNNVKIPPSLKNIYKELYADIGIKRVSGNLTDWAKQGVLLLNRVLTVRAGLPNSHKNIGWMEFTQRAIKLVSSQENPLVFMLWGSEARKLKSIISSHHLILEAPHPSPLSSYRGFFGCKHFSNCNKFLKDNNIDKIIWG